MTVRGISLLHASSLVLKLPTFDSRPEHDSGLDKGVEVGEISQWRVWVAAVAESAGSELLCIMPRTLLEP